MLFAIPFSILHLFHLHASSASLLQIILAIILPDNESSHKLHQFISFVHHLATYQLSSHMWLCISPLIFTSFPFVLDFSSIFHNMSTILVIMMMGKAGEEDGEVMLQNMMKENSLCKSETVLRVKNEDRYRPPFKLSTFISARLHNYHSHHITSNTSYAHILHHFWW